MTSNRILISAVGLGLVAGSMAQVSASGSGYSFKSKYTKGQTVKYAMTMSATGPQPYKGFIDTTLKVLSVDKQGAATIEATVKAPGRPAQTSKVTIDKFGKPVSNEYGTFTGNLGLPEKPVKVGESWKGVVNLSNSAVGGDVSAKYTFRGITTVDGQKVARISMNLDLTGVFGMTGTGDQFIRVSDGLLHKSTMNMVMNIPDPKTKKNISAKINMTVNRAK